MKPSKRLGFTNIILLVIGIVVAVIIVGSLFLIKQNKKEKSYIPAPTNVPATSAPRSSIQWKTYTNDFLKFKLDYPVNWSILELDTDVIFASTKEGLNRDETRKNELRVFIGRTSLLESQDLEKYVAEIDKRSKPEVLDKESIKVDDNNAIRRIINNEYKSLIIYIQSGSRIFTISATPADSELMPIFDQMLQTFKFTN